MLNKEIIIGFFVLIIIIGIVIYRLKSNEKFESKKSIKYFGANYCPFSNTDSAAYKVIKEFEEKYKDKVDVKYIWTETDGDYMKAYNIEYVPTILNTSDKEIQLGLPKNTDITKPTTELKTILLENIYNKL